ncbi:MAG: radical SAM protein, partial [Brevibacterium sp.]|nr:radical SAM protein [Brevibacterium sp.]
MRWNQQSALDPAASTAAAGTAASGTVAAGTDAPPAELFGVTGLVRSVRTPEFAGVTFHEVLAKSALNKVPAASSMPFTWTINPYRGCS